MNVAQWLNAIDLGQYEAVFREHEIDAGVLRDLVEADLEKIGVPLGHRKRLLKAIAALGTSETAATPQNLARASSPAAERRPITVMFCDLVGSTSLAAKLDAEDWRDLVGAYLDEASVAVTGLGGHVLKKLGDGLMALFGYPHAQENDAERAVRAALAILSALESLNARNVARGLPPLAARIGLESGPVVVDHTGEVFGDAPNVAARVQAIAEPGKLLVTASVQRQVAGLFVAEDKGPHDLKGVPGRPILYRIVRASGGGRRLGSRTLTRFVGREDELAVLLKRWERARGGEGQLVEIVGEPGLGKSRLMEEFRACLVEVPHTWVEWSSSQLLQNTPLHPVAEWGRQRFGGAEIAAERRFADLEAVLAHLKIDPAEHAPLLAPLLDIPLPEGRALQLPSEETRRRQLAAIVGWLMAGARQQPIALAFEDLHWADPTTLDLMKTLAERGGQAPLLIVATARPEFRAPWAMRSHHGVISLAPLDRSQIHRMIGAITERHVLPKDAVEGLSERAAGVPLFVEELTRLMLEGGAQTIPPTLQQSLAARLDRLGKAREVAQVGAVLGREFSHALLMAVADLPDRELGEALEKLAHADLLFVEGAAPACVYRFKHALIQDAAYDSVLKARRQALHRRAAELLATSSDPPLELVAHHFTQSGLSDQAIEWWGKAGEAALKRSAFKEAIAHLGHAIEMAEKEAAPTDGQSGNQAALADVETKAAFVDSEVQPGPRAALRNNRLRASYARALLAAEGYTSPAAQIAFQRAGGSEEGHYDDPQFQRLFYGHCLRLMAAGHLTEGLEYAEARLRQVPKGTRSLFVPLALRLIAHFQFNLGRLGRAMDEAHRAKAAFEPDWDQAYRAITPHDFTNAVDYLIANLEWITGDAHRAFARARETRRHAEETGEPFTLAIVLSFLATLYCLADMVPETLEISDALVDITSAHGISFYARLGAVNRAWAAGRLGDPQESARAVRSAIALRIENGEGFFETLALAQLAQLQILAKDFEGALATLDEASASVDRTGEAVGQARLQTLRGDCLLLTDVIAAEEAYLRALSVARAQGARTFELQAAIPLARLLQSTNRPLEAYAALAPAVEGFSSTPEMPEIAEALELMAAIKALPQL